MKTALHIIKSWFETGDLPTEQQFANTWDSFHHKDDGEAIKTYQVDDKGTVTFVLTNDETIRIEKFIPVNSQPISYIDGLQNILDQAILDISKKVDKENGKGLSEANYSQVEKEKLEGLQNFIPDTSKPISYIEGLQGAIDQILQDVSMKVEKEDGKGLSDTNFSQAEKDKLATLTLSENTNASYLKRITDLDFDIATNTFSFSDGSVLGKGDVLYYDGDGGITIDLGNQGEADSDDILVYQHTFINNSDATIAFTSSAGANISVPTGKELGISGKGTVYMVNMFQGGVGFWFLTGDLNAIQTGYTGSFPVNNYSENVVVKNGNILDVIPVGEGESEGE